VTVAEFIAILAKHPPDWPIDYDDPDFPGRAGRSDWITVTDGDRCVLLGGFPFPDPSLDE
jgi:hypothetical protein